MALHKKSLHIDFSVQPLCSLCLGGVFLLGIHQPQRPREHRGCTEKRAFVTLCAKPHDVIERRAEDSQKNKIRNKNEFSDEFSLMHLGS